MEFRRINWQEMIKLYEQYGINAINFPIVDMDVMDMSTKLQRVAEILKTLISKYHVHFT